MPRHSRGESRQARASGWHYLGPVPETLFSDGALQFRQLVQLDGDVSAPVELIIGR